MNRLHTLDYLRGLAAFSIMIYHYASWSIGHYESDSVLGRIGLYGVSIFYILSGLTLYLVYRNKFILKDFIIKRIFRIFPLMWLVITLTILINGMPDLRAVIANATGIFGFIKPTAYVGMGMWSIGNELVFYAFFPVMIYCINKKRVLFPILMAILFLVFCFFAFSFLVPTSDLTVEWPKYVNPLNQVFLFGCGVTMGLVFSEVKITNVVLSVLLLVSLASFALYPVYGNRIALVTGWNRLLFTAIMFAICFCFFKITFELPRFLHKPLAVLGEASYSVYLIHPLVYPLLRRFLPLPTGWLITISAVVTIGVSYLIFLYFEKYFVTLGKQFAKKKQKSIASAV